MADQTPESRDSRTFLEGLPTLDVLILLMESRFNEPRKAQASSPEASRGTRGRGQG